MDIPSFDEWFLGRYGSTFQDKWMQPEMLAVVAHKALLDTSIEYLTFAARYIAAQKDAT